MKLKVTTGFNERNLSAIKQIICCVYNNTLQHAIKSFKSLKINCHYLKRGYSEIFVVWCNEVPVTAAVAYYDAHSAAKYENSGFFNFFESINDINAVELLFLSIQNWLKAFSVDYLVGPMSPIMSDLRGLCVDNLNILPVFGMPSNPEYYPELLEKFGFSKLKDLYGLQIHFPIDEARLSKISKFAKTRVSNTCIRNLDLKNIEKDVWSIVNIYNEGWNRNWGFIPIEYEEFYDSVISMKQLIKPEYGIFIEVDKKPVAFQLIVPDFNIAISKSSKYNNKLIRNIVFLRSLRKTKQYRALFIGVLPKYRRLGFESILMENAFKLKMKAIHIGWVLEDNVALRNVINNILGFEPDKKTYRLYRYKAS